MTRFWTLIWSLIVVAFIYEMTELIKCNDCGKKISKTAQKCLYCGSEYPTKSVIKKKFISASIILALIALILVAVINL